MVTNNKALLCKNCAHYETCEKPCIYVDNIAYDGTKKDEFSFCFDDNRITADYKEILEEIKKGAEKRKRNINIESIRNIKDMRLRAIATMIYAKISIMDIANLLNRSESQIYRIIKKGGSKG